jgi:hypothetical protein
MAHTGTLDSTRLDSTRDSTSTQLSRVKSSQSLIIIFNIHGHPLATPLQPLYSKRAVACYIIVQVSISCFRSIGFGDPKDAVRNPDNCSESRKMLHDIQATATAFVAAFPVW